MADILFLDLNDNGAIIMSRKWGLLPEDVRALVLKREWHNRSRLKQRLLGVLTEVKIGLKPPSGSAVIEDIGHFQTYIAAWRAFTPQALVVWENKNYRQLGEQKIATFFALNDLPSLIDFVGAEGVKHHQQWLAVMTPILTLSQQLYPVLVKHLDTVETLTVDDAQLIAQLLPQLKPGMGQGSYLRALPLCGVDTKFLEKHHLLVADLLDCLYDDALSAQGGLLAWLDCQDNPKGWLTIRPLCQQTAAQMGGLSILQLPIETLKTKPLPAQHILVVENMQSGLGLGPMDNTIAVFGGGKNISWMEADWLQDKKVAYWGDIDTWGLAILSDVRRRWPNIVALMMDETTVFTHQQRMVTEEKPVETLPEYLNAEETKLFEQLKTGHFAGSRLEQERLSPDYIQATLLEWLLS